MNWVHLQMLRLKFDSYYRLNKKRVYCLIFCCLFLFTLLIVSLNKNPNRHLHISSVYYVANSGSNYSQNVVRLLALSENGLSTQDIMCEIDGNPIKGHVNLGIGSDLCKWQTYLIDCPIDSKPENVALISNDGINKHELKITEPDKTPRTLVVCFSRMFFFEKWQILLASLELYSYYGADLMVIPLVSVIEKLYHILRAYEETGKLRIKQTALIPQFPDLNYNANGQVEWFNQVISYTECLYDYRESAEFILNVDIDDILIPKYPFNNIKDEMKYLANKFPTAASFEFMWAATLGKISRDPKSYQISDLIKKSYVGEVLPYGKSVIRPKRVKMAFNHNVTSNELLTGYEHQVLGINSSYVVHFKTLIDTGFYIPKSSAYFTQNTSNYDQVDRNFQHFLSTNLFAKQAFSEFPTKIKYLFHVRNCYSRISKWMKRGKQLDQCPNPLSCLYLYKGQKEYYPPCVVLKNTYKHSTFESKLLISSIDQWEFNASENCLTFW